MYLTLRNCCKCTKVSVIYILEIADVDFCFNSVFLRHIQEIIMANFIEIFVDLYSRKTVDNPEVILSVGFETSRVVKVFWIDNFQPCWWVPCFDGTYFHTLFWRWKQYVPAKRYYPPVRPDYVVITQHVYLYKLFIRKLYLWH